LLEKNKIALLKRYNFALIVLIIGSLIAIHSVTYGHRYYIEPYLYTIKVLWTMHICFSFMSILLSVIAWILYKKEKQYFITIAIIMSVISLMLFVFALLTALLGMFAPDKIYNLYWNIRLHL